MLLFSKWYCDCVTDQGDAFIGYWARLRRGLASVPYAATIWKPAAKPAVEQRTLRRTTAPVSTSGGLHWNCRRLGLRATWTLRAIPYSRTLLQTPDASIVWRCRFPCADARVDLDGGNQLSGLGYAEQLDVALKRMRMPFQEIRWGRFLSAQDSITGPKCTA